MAYQNDSLLINLWDCFGKLILTLCGLPVVLADAALCFMGFFHLNFCAIANVRLVLFTLQRD